MQSSTLDTYKLNSYKPRGLASRQQGAALVVGLIMLLLLTLIGVAGMKDTLLQEKMAGNMRDRDMALQGAEAALRAAENVLGATTEPTFNNTNGMYDVTLLVSGESPTVRKNGSTRVSELQYWRDVWKTKWATASAAAYPSTLDGVSSQPRYVIEKLDKKLTDRKQYAVGGTTMVISEDVGEVEQISSDPDYRVTAFANGASADSSAILQSTFRRKSTN